MTANPVGVASDVIGDECALTGCTDRRRPGYRTCSVPHEAAWITDLYANTREEVSGE